MELISDHPALVRRMFGYCKKMTGQSAQLLVRQNKRLNRRNSYILRLIGRETVLGPVSYTHLETKPHAWFTGFIQDEEYPYAIVVMLENAGGGGSQAAPIAASVLKKTMELIK